MSEQTHYITNEYNHTQAVIDDEGDISYVCVNCHGLYTNRYGHGTACNLCRDDFDRECRADYA